MTDKLANDFLGCNPFSLTLAEVKAARGPGWAMSHPRYGIWFLPREAVAYDWAEHQRQMGEDSESPSDFCEDVMNTWLYEQMGWWAVHAFGTQLQRPDVGKLEAEVLSAMSHNTDNLGHYAYESGPEEVATCPPQAPTEKKVELQMVLPARVGQRATRAVSSVMAELGKARESGKISKKKAQDLFDSLQATLAELEDQVTYL